MGYADAESRPTTMEDSMNIHVTQKDIDKGTRGDPGACLGGWTIRKQTNKQSETMIFNIAVTQLPTPLEVQQENRQEKMIVAPDTILARDQNIATVVFGAKHAKEILAANPDLLQLHVRQGV